MTIQFTQEQALAEAKKHFADPDGSLSLLTPELTLYANAIALQVSAAYEANEQRLREALLEIYQDAMDVDIEKMAGDAISQPASTDALDKYVAEQTAELQAKLEAAEKRIKELEPEANIAKSRKVTGWLRGHEFIPLPELAKPADTPLFTLSAAIEAEKGGE